MNILISNRMTKRCAHQQHRGGIRIRNTCYNRIDPGISLTTQSSWSHMCHVFWANLAILLPHSLTHTHLSPQVPTDQPTNNLLSSLRGTPKLCETAIAMRGLLEAWDGRRLWHSFHATCVNKAYHSKCTTWFPPSWAPHLPFEGSQTTLVAQGFAYRNWSLKSWQTEEQLGRIRESRKRLFLSQGNGTQSYLCRSLWVVEEWAYEYWCIHYLAGLRTRPWSLAAPCLPNCVSASLWPSTAISSSCFDR